MKSQKSLRSKHGQPVIITTSWDDFTEHDTRLAQLLIEYSIPATFFIPAGLLYQAEKLKFAKELTKHFDIGSHTINHTILTTIPAERVDEELQMSKKILETKLDVPVEQFCYPRGRFTNETQEAVKRAGYTSARTTWVLSTAMPTDPYAIATTIHTYHGRKEYGDRTWVQLACEKFDHVILQGGYFHLWGHSLEMDRNGEWTNLEWFLSYMNEKMHENL